MAPEKPSALLSAPVQTLLALACLVVIAAGMRAASSLIIPFLLAALITVVCLPTLNLLKSKGVPGWLAILFILSVLLIGGYLLVATLTISLDGFISRLPRYEERLNTYLTTMEPLLVQLGLDSEWLDMPRIVEPESLMRFLGGLVNGVRGLLSHGLIVFLTVFFMLLEAHTLPRRLESASSNPARTSEILTGFIHDLYRYLGIKTLTSILTGFFIGCWLWAFSVDFALLWGVVAFLLNFIPTIGSLVAAIPGILVALIQHGPETALWVTIGYLVVNQSIGSLIEPKVLGDRLGLSALVVFMSLVFWGWILGPAGMFLAVPLSMMAKLALASHHRTEPLARLISSGFRSRAAGNQQDQAST